MEQKLGRREILNGGLGLGVAGIGLAHSRAARAASKQAINLVSTSGTLSLVGAVILKELKLFDKYDVEVNQIVVSDGSKILAGIIGGSGDICGGSGFGGLFPAIQKGATIKILAGAQIAPDSVLFASDKYPELKSITDLPGHTVGTGEVGALLYILSVADMQKYKVDYKKVNFVNVGGSPDVFKALVSGSIQAGAAPVQYLDTAGQYGLHVLDHGVFYKELPLFTNQAMFASNEAIATKRDGLVRTMAALADQFHWIANPANKVEWQKFYKQALGSKAKDDEMNASQKFYGTPGNLATNLVLSKQQIDYIQNLNIEAGAQKTAVPVDQAVDMSLAEDAIKLYKSKA